MISRDIIEAIRERTDLAEVVSQVVTLQRKGGSLMGLCPFHQEKSPSFSVVPHKGIYHCFGCGEGGDVFRFVEKTRGIQFFEAVKELAEACGIKVEERELSPEERRRLRARADLHEVCELACGFFQQNLLARAEGKAARAYLESRGMAAKTIEKYRLGYAPEAWDGLLNYLHKQGVDADLAVNAGLARKRNTGGTGRGAYDLFRDRLIIPIEDARGRVVAFGGRTMPGAPSDSPKYVNSPETEIYKKSSVLYGLNHARAAVQRKGRMLVVEGYFDVLSLHQAGFEEAVATCGTSLTDEHMRAIRPLSSVVYTLFDLDEAGERAAVRSLSMFLKEGIQPYRLRASGSKDPDELIRDQGPQAFEALINEAEPVIDLLIRRSVDRHGTDAAALDRVLGDLAPVLRYYKGASLTKITETLSRRFGILMPAVTERLGTRLDTGPQQSGPQSQAPPLRWRGNPELNHILWMLIHHPARVAHVIAEADPELVTDRLSARQAIGMLLAREPLPRVLQAVQDPDLERILRAAAAKEGLYTADQAERAAHGILDRLEMNHIKAELARIDQALAGSAQSGDKSGLDLLKRRQELQRKRQTLQQRPPRGAEP